MNYLMVGYETMLRTVSPDILEGKQEPSVTVPYLNKLKRAVIRGVVNEKNVQFSTDARSTYCASVQVADYITKLAADGATKPHGAPAFTLIGFSPRAFYKLVGIDCSLPGGDANIALPYSLWGGHSEYWDIESVLMVNGTGSPKHLTLPDIFAMYAELYGETPDGERFRALTDKWTGPHQAAERDLDLVHFFAERLGITG